MSSTTIPIYLDHAAATTLEAEALEAMSEAARLQPAHPSASHAPGRRLRARIERSRTQVAEYLGCDATELRFERSGTDALAFGIDAALRRSTGAVVSTHLEHPFVRDELARHERAGREIRWLPTPRGELRLPECSALFEGASVIVLSKLQHELGTVLDFEPLWSLAPNAYWVIDAVQAAAWLELGSLYRDRVFVDVSSYKFGGPPGAAALRIPPGLPQVPSSGDQPAENTERGLDWIALAGFGGACMARVGRRDAARERAVRLGQRLYEGLLASRAGGVRNAENSWLGPILSAS
ncbi:MAG TPA: aminotransferase class V-fold PLP-dependent enzyme, partial [Polyangiaceae bacterium]